MTLSNYVLFFAGQRLQISWASTLPQSFVTRGEHFTAIEYGKVHGHHDWLRRSRSEIVGVRHWFLGATRQVVDRVRLASYANVWPCGSVIELFTTNSKVYSDELSQDHILGEGEVYISPAGIVVFGYPTPPNQCKLLADELTDVPPDQIIGRGDK